MRGIKYHNPLLGPRAFMTPADRAMVELDNWPARHYTRICCNCGSKIRRDLCKNERGYRVRLYCEGCRLKKRKVIDDKRRGFKGFKFDK